MAFKISFTVEGCDAKEIMDDFARRTAKELDALWRSQGIKVVVFEPKRDDEPGIKDYL